MKRTLLLCLIGLSIRASAEITLNALFSDHAVLQRDRDLPGWGTAFPGEVVTVKLGAQNMQTTADANGAWRVVLKSMKAGGPYEMTVSGSNTIVVHDLLVGEVWLASGQSNMEFAVEGTLHGTEAAADGNHPQLRLFFEGARPLAEPASSPVGTWRVASPATVGKFTAVGYFFALSLLNDLKVPVGIISASVGATPAEAWTPLPLLKADPLFAAMATKQNQELREAVDGAHVADALAGWEKTYGAADPGNTGFVKGFASPKAELKGWQTITLPARGNKLGLTGAAAVWVRRDINLPERTYDKSARLELGPLHEVDTVYFDGVKVGAGVPGPEPFGRNVNYGVPVAMLHPGKHTIAIRVFAHQPSTLVIASQSMAMTFPDSAKGDRHLSLPLTGEWSFGVEWQKPLTPEAMKTQPQMPQFKATEIAGSLYNGEIAPLGDYALRGALWYQGEDNATRAAAYTDLMTQLITGWRKQFGQEFPFYIAQLPNHAGGRTGWELLRDQQQRITQVVPNTAIAVTLGLGEKDMIHPPNKQPVGERLALLARHRVYGESIEDSGPFYKSMKVSGNNVTLEFTHAEGLHSTGSTIPNFAIAGADQKFVPANASIDGDKIVVSSPDVSAPVAVRYAWSQDPEGTDLFNASDLPMAPFRTDDWPLPSQPVH